MPSSHCRGCSGGQNWSLEPSCFSPASQLWETLEYGPRTMGFHEMNSSNAVQVIEGRERVLSPAMFRESWSTAMDRALCPRISPGFRRGFSTVCCQVRPDQ